jgi:hypothetical protein
MNENMPRAERAVILSAGQGSRLLPLTEDLPKCLLDLEGRSMLEWQLRALPRSASRGGRHHRLSQREGRGRDRADRAAGHVGTHPLQPFYKVADNLASCWMARAELRGTACCSTATPCSSHGSPAACSRRRRHRSP